MLVRWRGLDRRERLWLLRALRDLPLLRASLAVAGYARTLDWWTTLPRPGSSSHASTLDPQRLAQLAAIAGKRGWPKCGCLPQAIWVHGVLKRQGLPVQIRLGARVRATGFDAHAWVELDGVPIGQANLQHTPFPTAGRERES